MKTLLRIDASARVKESYSRRLADTFQSHWQRENSDGIINHIDLASYIIPHVTENTIQGFYTPLSTQSKEHKDSLKFSDEIIDQFKTCDEIIISSPLYNLSVPSSLKAMIDQMVRINKTFQPDETGKNVGLLKGKSAHLILVKGGKYKGTEMEMYDLQEPYLKAVLGYIGIDVKNIFSLEGTSYANEIDNSMQEIEKEIIESFKN